MSASAKILVTSRSARDKSRLGTRATLKTRICTCCFANVKFRSPTSGCEPSVTDTHAFDNVTATTSRSFTLNMPAISSGEIKVGASSGCLQLLKNVRATNAHHRVSSCEQKVCGEK